MTTTWEAMAREAMGEEDQPKRYLKVTRLSDIAMKATRWLWEDDNGDRWIPMGELVGLGGREGVGKSTWCANTIAKLTTGTLPGDFYGKPKGAVIVTTEDDWEATVKPRLAAAGADLDKVYRVEAVQADGLEDILSLPNDLAEVERIVKENDVALIVLDPLLTFVNKKLDTHKDAEVRQALEPVGRLAHNTRSSLIGLIHVNKTSEGDLMNRLMASRAIGAVVRGVLFCASYKPIEQNGDESGEDPPFEVIEPKRSRFVLGQIKNNLAPKVMRSVEYHIEGQIVGHDNEAQRDIEGSRIVIDRVIEENVEDIVLEQERRKKSAKT
jgi:RecA-family ATPase